MAKKKAKRAQGDRPKGWLMSKKQINNWLGQITQQILRQDYPGAIQTGQRVLRYVPAPAQERAEALEHLATAFMMLKQFEEGYQALGEALEIKPDQAYLWYNRGMAGRYTMRLAQALRDFEKAVELEAEPKQREKFEEILRQTREMAEQERALRGPDFTLEQLQEQQELFSRGIQLMQAERWAEAEESFRRVTSMGEDCLPQPYGNLGLALLMQRQYDEAEAAFKHALEIDPDYDLAQRNLAALPLTRQSGELPRFTIRDPMAGAKLNLTVQTVDDD